MYTIPEPISRPASGDRGFKIYSNKDEDSISLGKRSQSFSYDIPLGQEVLKMALNHLRPMYPPEPSNDPKVLFKRVQPEDRFGSPDMYAKVACLVSNLSNSQDQDLEPALVKKETRSYKSNVIYTEDKEIEKIPKENKHIQIIKCFEAILQYYYLCEPWSESMERTVKQINTNEFFLKHIGPAIFGDKLRAESCAIFLQERPPKEKRKDELQKKVLSKARWEASRINVVLGPGEVVPLPKLILDKALEDCGNDETKMVEVEKALRRIFGNVNKECSYREVRYEMEKMINEEKEITQKEELLQIISRLFTKEICELRDSSKRVIQAVEQGCRNIPGMKDELKAEMQTLAAKATQIIGSSLVKEGLHNEAARLMITNNTIIKYMLSQSFLKTVLDALDKQTVSDIQTNFVSKLKAAFYDLENGASKEQVKDYLDRCFNTTKFSKHPLTKIQNAQAMVDYLHKLNYRAKSEIEDSKAKIKQELKTLKGEFERELKARKDFKSGGSDKWVS